MARSKKNQEEIENLEPEMDEALEAVEEADEEIDLEAADEVDGEAGEEKPARKARARKPRAKKVKEPTSLLATMAEPVEEAQTEEEAEAEGFEAKDEEKPAAKPRGRRKSPAAEEKEEAEAVAKPWAAVKEISVSISSNLERVNQMLKEIPQAELFRPPIAKPAGITKVAIGMSFFAIVLSLVSLLLSQSARQVALDRFTAPNTALTQSVQTSPNEPKQLALETAKRKPQRAAKQHR